jgi:CubicO group peptidase (beta-lactamase class C family)
MRRQLLGLVLCAATPLAAQLPSARAPLHAGAAARLGAILDQTVAEGRAAGIVATVLQGGKVVYQHATGMADREANRAMTLDTRFRIASQSKAITSVVIMTLIEEGRMALSDPITRWLPDFANTKVSVPDSATGGRKLVPLRRPITVRDLLTHSAGMSYGGEAYVADAYAARGLGREAGNGWYFAHKTTDICTALAPLAELPLVAQPGERFVYGYATDVLGCLVERITGQSLAAVVKERITDPLGMTRTSFCVAKGDAATVAAVYALQNGTLTRAPEGPRGQGDYIDGPCVAFAGGAGLVSTAADYATFLEMLRQGGTYNGHRVISPASVALMTRDHLGPVYRADGVAGFGLGFEVWHHPARAGRYGAPGQWSWGGAYHTTYWVDPEHELVAVLMVQLMPAQGSVLQDRFRTGVHQALR